MVVTTAKNMKLTCPTEADSYGEAKNVKLTN